MRGWCFRQSPPMLYAASSSDWGSFLVPRSLGILLLNTSASTVYHLSHFIEEEESKSFDNRWRCRAFETIYTESN